MRIASLGSSESKADQSDQVPRKRTRKRRHLRSSPPYRSSASTSSSSSSSSSNGSRQTVQDDVLVPLLDCTELHRVASSCPMRGAGCDTETAFTFSSLSSSSSSTTTRSSASSAVTGLNYCGSPTGVLSQQNSPVDRTHSPGYDFRETTARRRSYLESTESSVQPMQYHPLACNQENQPHERSGRKSESPNRKRRRMSQGAVDLSTSPSPPSLVRPWQTSTSLGSGQWPGGIGQGTGYQGSSRYSPGDWCNSSGWRTAGRRSPPSMRRQSQRQRERQLRSQNNQQQQQQQQQQPTASGGDRRAFHPPNLQTTHHATVLPPPPSHHLPFQPHIIIDLSSDVRAHVPTTAPISIPVSVPSYAVPMCTAHTIPTCSLHHGPYTPIPVTAGGRPAHHGPPPPPAPIPICSMGHIPMCSVHIPACSGHHLPVSQASMPHVLPQESLMTHVHHHHVPPQVQYFAAPPPTQTRSSEVEIIGERPAAFHVPSSTQHNPSLTPSPPLHLLQESILRNQDMHHMHAYRSLNTIRQQQQQQQQRRAQATRPWRNQVSSSVPVQPSYPPTLLLRYLFPSPPVNQMELENEDAEVENYEALLNLAERLGEAKPRGLTKAYIDQLPSYLYKPDTHQSINDQTCCVVCMCDFEARQLLRVLPCSHEFHARCVDKWLKTNRTCPICRADASEMNNQSD